MKNYIVFSLLSILLLLSGCSLLKTEQTQEEMVTETTGDTAMMQHEDEAPSQDALQDSPRHQEWVTIDNQGKPIYTRVVYPEVSEKAPVVIVIHENKGLTDWVRQMADDIAAEGYIAIAPDLLSTNSGDKLRTSDYASDDEATQAIYKLSPEQVMSDLAAVYAYASGLDAASDLVTSAGFCWGGSQSFRFATVNPALDTAFVFYGTAPTEEEVYANMQVPVVAFYGGADERVNATIEQTQSYMDANNNSYTYQIYSGAWHAFMRSGVAPDASGANKAAREQAFTSLLENLESLQSENAN